MTPTNIKYALNTVKLYKLALKGLVAEIEQRFTSETIMNAYKHDEWLYVELIKNHASLDMNLQGTKLKLVSLLDRAIALPIKLKSIKGG